MRLELARGAMEMVNKVLCLVEFQSNKSFSFSVILCPTVCATPIMVMGSIMGLFPLCNGVDLVTAVR